MRGFLTLAFGSLDYLEMARSLLLSCRRFSSTPFAVVTDKPRHRLLADFDIIAPIDRAFGDGVAQKIHLDRYSPFDETLFIDSDCLFYKDPDLLWPLYSPHDDFGVKGWRYLKPSDRKEIADLLAKTGLSERPNLNGGIYYFRKTERALQVFDYARAVYDDRERLNLKPFKNAPLNEEIAYSLAMSAVGVRLLPWDNAMEMTFQMEPDHRIDIRIPSARFSVHGRDADPIVIHFNVGAQFSKLYLLESARIRLMTSRWQTFAGAYGRFQFIRKNARRLRRRVPAKLRSLYQAH